MTGMPLWILCALLAQLSLVTATAQLSPIDKPAEVLGEVPPPSNALDKDDLEFYVRHLNVYGPQIDVVVGDFEPSGIPGLLRTVVTASRQMVSKKHTFFVSEDGKHVMEGSAYEIDKNPFYKTNEAINTLAAPAFGKEGASVVVVAYSDFQCPYCAEEAKVLRNNLKNQYESRVRVYFRDFPLAMHNWAKPAAIAGRCVYVQEPEAFWTFHDWIFANQKAVTPENLLDKLKAWALGTSLDAAKLEQCVAGNETEKQVAESMEEGAALGVNSTPTLFVNGRKLGGSYKWEQLKAVIDYELDYQEITHNAGDDCGCSVEVGFP